MVACRSRLALAVAAVSLLAAACSGGSVNLDRGNGDMGADADARVTPPLPWGVREIWYNQTGLLLTVDEEVWADRLDKVCKTALGPDIDSPVWDREAAQALAEEFAVADGLRPDLPPESRQQLFHALASGTLWIMIVQRAGPDGPSACWDRVPREFLETKPLGGGGWSRPPGFETLMTEEALAAVQARFDRMLSWVDPPLTPGTREIWWEATGLRATIDEDIWASRLNRACHTPRWGAGFDRDDAAVLAEEIIVEEGVEPTPELVEAGADALWRMTDVPPLMVCPQRYPPEP